MIGIVLLVAAVALIVATEWPRLGARAGFDESSRRERSAGSRIFASSRPTRTTSPAAVERDLANLPTIDHASGRTTSRSSR